MIWQIRSVRLSTLFFVRVGITSHAHCLWPSPYLLEDWPPITGVEDGNPRLNLGNTQRPECILLRLKK